MNTNKLQDYLGHMQSAAEDACSFIVGMSKTAFFDDKRSQNAVVISLIVLDFEMAWETVTTALPELMVQLPAVFRGVGDDSL